jgi:hypothetical protein
MVEMSLLLLLLFCFVLVWLLVLVANYSSVLVACRSAHVYYVRVCVL